jgi:hypothetical protein
MQVHAVNGAEVRRKECFVYAVNCAELKQFTRSNCQELLYCQEITDIQLLMPHEEGEMSCI